ncbi:MAG: SIS domain-containing protein [Thermoplasmatota archaeon]
MDITTDYDTQDFLGDIRRKPDLIRSGYAVGIEAAHPMEATGLLFAGMGGSGATANLVRDACTRAMHMPFSIVQHYQIPNHVKKSWRVLALSYSGNTEEVLSVVQDARRRQIPVTAFTTGGELQEHADVMIRQPDGFQPRVALAHPWFSVLGYLEGSGVLTEKVPVEAAARGVEAMDALCGPEVPEERNEAKQVARRLADKIPQIYATPAFYGVGAYLRAMLNENAKKIAGLELIPECNHNDLMGWGSDEARHHFTCLTLSHGFQNPEIQKRIQFMEQRYMDWGIDWHHHQFDPIGGFASHVIEQAKAIQFADYVSFYVAMLRGVDPAHITAITALKEFLRNH